MKQLEDVWSYFSRWVLWEERSTIAKIDFPGVYMLCRSTKKQPRFYLSNKSILYIGETVRQSLAGRLYQFDRSAFQSKPGHSGGWTYQEKIAKTSRGLYVSVFAVEDEEPFLSAFIRFVERKLLLEFVAKHGCYPACNKK